MCRIFGVCYSPARHSGQIKRKLRNGEMRDKRAKFVELVENRVNRAIKDIRLIGNLANRSAYQYTDDDVRRVFRALQREIESAKARFSGDSGGRDNDFKLGE